MKPENDPGTEKKAEEIKQKVEATLEAATESESDELSDPEMQSITGGTSNPSAYCDP